MLHRVLWYFTDYNQAVRVRGVFWQAKKEKKDTTQQIQYLLVQHSTVSYLFIPGATAKEAQRELPGRDGTCVWRGRGRHDDSLPANPGSVSWDSIRFDSTGLGAFPAGTVGITDRDTRGHNSRPKAVRWAAMKHSGRGNSVGGGIELVRRDNLALRICIHVGNPVRRDTQLGG